MQPLPTALTTQAAASAVGTGAATPLAAVAGAGAALVAGRDAAAERAVVAALPSAVERALARQQAAWSACLQGCCAQQAAAWGLKGTTAVHKSRCQQYVSN